MKQLKWRLKCSKVILSSPYIPCEAILVYCDLLLRCIFTIVITIILKAILCHKCRNNSIKRPGCLVTFAASREGASSRQRFFRTGCLCLFLKNNQISKQNFNIYLKRIDNRNCNTVSVQREGILIYFDAYNPKSTRALWRYQIDWFLFNIYFCLWFWTKAKLFNLKTWLKIS